MSRVTPTSSRASPSTPKPQLDQPSTLPAPLASVLGDSTGKESSSSSPSPAPVSSRKPSPLQTLLASVPNDSIVQSPSGSASFGFFDSRLPPLPPPPQPQYPAFPGHSQDPVLPSPAQHLSPGHPQYPAPPLRHVLPRSSDPQLSQQQQQQPTYLESSYTQTPSHSRPPPQFNPQQAQQQIHQQYSFVPSKYQAQAQAQSQQYSFVPSKYQAQLAPQYAPQPKSDRELNLIQSEYGIQMARQEVGNDKAAAATKPATSVHKGAQPAVAKSKPIAIAPAQTKPAASKAKPATQAKAKVAPKAAAKPAPEVAPELAPETKITGAQHKKVARFDWLLRTFLNSLNAIYDEFGGIPDQIKIVDDGLGRHHAQAVVEGYTGEVDDEEGFVDPTPQIDVNKLLIANSWDGSKRLKGLNIPEPMPHSVKLMTTEYSNQGLRPQPPQYAIDADGTVQLAEPVYQKPEHVLQILDHLQNSPLGFASDSSAPATPNISVKDGKVTLEAAQWDVVKDCLSVVHYMNDYSKIGQVDMYREARASWIRMFGWAPGIDEMIQAKQRAHEFREEKGLHTHALATRIWIADEKGARERRDCAVYQPEEMFATPEAPTTAHVSHVSQAPLTQPGPALAKNHITPASELAGKPDDSATGKAEIVVLKAAINANGKAFIPGRTAKGPILPSMAAHTMIYHPPRQASAAPSSSSRTTVVIDLSNDEDAGDIDAAQEEKTGHHPVSNPTTPELVDPPMPTRDLVLHPYADVQEVSRKRKVSPNSPTSSPGASKRQAMGSGAHLKDNGGAQGSGGLGSTGIGGFPGVANDVGVYLRWEEARNGIKKEKHVARRKAGESLMIGQPGHS